MAAPKPWESSVPMSSQILPSSFDSINNGMVPTIETARTQGGVPPPPPRNVQQPMGMGMGMGMGYYPQSNYLSPYSLSPYQAGGGYYNNYRLSPYGTPTNYPVSNFAQLAIDESRSAFSSIESVIHAFRSISVVLESTFTSVYSSFRAITDLLDQFTRIRSEVTALYPLLVLWKFLKYLYHRLLRLLHLRRSTPGNIEETWSSIYHSLQQTTANSNQGPMPTSSSSSSLLVALFFVVSLGTPILMLKFINSIIQKRQKSNNWLEQEKSQSQVVALYDYIARNPDELSFRRGATIYLAPLSMQSTSSNWFLGSVDRIHTGLVPVNYIQIVKPVANSNITLHPQQPFNTTSTDAAAPSPPVPQSSSTVNNIPQSVFQAQEKPTLS